LISKVPSVLTILEGVEPPKLFDPGGEVTASKLVMVAVLTPAAVVACSFKAPVVAPV
jgi:hypothetical protein